MTTETNISNADFNIGRANAMLRTAIYAIEEAEAELGKSFGNLANITADLFAVDKKLEKQRAELGVSADKNELTIDVFEAFITAVKDFRSFDCGSETMYFTDIRNLTCPPNIAKDHYKSLNFRSLADEVAEELDGYGGHDYDEFKSEIVRRDCEYFIWHRADLEEQANKLLETFNEENN